MGVPYCFHVPDTVIELKDAEFSHRAKSRTGAYLHGRQRRRAKGQVGPLSPQPRLDVFNTACTREMLTSKVGGEAARSEMIARAVAALNRFIDVYRVVTNNAHMQRLSSVHVRDIFMREHNIGFHGASALHEASKTRFVAGEDAGKLLRPEMFRHDLTQNVAEVGGQRKVPAFV